MSFAAARRFTGEHRRPADALPHPGRENYQSFADFTDPDGNIWILQEVDRSKAQSGSN